MCWSEKFKDIHMYRCLKANRDEDNVPESYLKISQFNKTKENQENDK